MNLTVEQIKDVHATLQESGFPRTHNGASKWLIKHGYSAEELRGRGLLELYANIWVLVNTPL